MTERRLSTSSLKKVPSVSSMASLKDLRIAKSGEPNESSDGVQDLEYEVTLMYGKYSANLAEYAIKEAHRVQNEWQKEEILFTKELQPYRGRIFRVLVKVVRPIWDHTFARLGEDWVFLFILGTCMAALSFSIDYFVYVCFRVRMYLNEDLLQDIHWTLQLFAWIAIPTLLVIFSAAFCQWLAPSAAGSGIPEMKTILRGVMLKEYLTWKTLLAKIVGLAAVLGAGLPLGKEGPVMHMASIVSNMLMSLLKAIKGVVDNEAHSTDLLAAACTMGVAVCYAAPIGGVLFSIEVTTVYFAVRNYWRGFFAAVVGAMFYRLMSVWFMNEETIYPIYKVELNFAFPYDVIELLPFLCIGIFCGFAGSLFVYLHRRYVIFVRQNQTLNKILKTRRLLYPTIISLVISFTTFPEILGQFMASTITVKQQILDFFSNVTWTVHEGDEITLEQSQILEHWVRSSFQNFHVSLFIFQVVTVIEIAIASTLPVPSGILIPLFKCGAAFGRQIGELMVFLYPTGIRAGHPIVPGAYAMVGAASFCAAITHTISISVIVFELTGQITYVIPIMIGVLISNCISSLLQPSIYDSVIRIKKLPYLPDIFTTTSDVYNIYVEDIMIRDVKYIWHGINYLDLKDNIKDNKKLKYFPIVDKHDSMILLGSIPRIELVRLLVEQISSSKRKSVAKARHLQEIRSQWELGGSTVHDKLKNDRSSSSSEDEDESNSGHIFKKISHSLSKSLSKSTRSLTKQFSSVDSHPSLSDIANMMKLGHGNESPKFERKGSRFSVSRVPGATNANASNKERKSDLGNYPNETCNSASPLNLQNDEDYEETQSSSRRRLSYEDTDLASLENKDKGMYQDKWSKQSSQEDLPSSTRAKTNLHLQRSNSLATLANFAGDKTSKVRTKIAKGREESTPKRGILKRRNSLSLGSLSMTGNSQSYNQEDNYQTVSVVDTKLRNALEKVKRMKNDTTTSMEMKLSQISLFKSKKKENGKKKEIDMTDEEREEWELQELSKEVDFSKCHIDPSPFQLVERTSLLRVHSLFSMLGINHAYVTAIGRLIGVVALKELRAAIEGQYIGKFNSNPSQTKSNLPASPIRRRSSISSLQAKKFHPSLDVESGIKRL